MSRFCFASTRQPFDFQAQVIVRPDFQLHGWYLIVSSFFEVHAAKDVYDTKTPAKHRGCWLVSTAFKVRRYSSKPWMKERLLNILAVGTEISRNPYLCPRLKESWIQAVDNNLVDSAFSHNTLLHKLKIKFGIGGNLLSLLTCHLNHRAQVTVVNSPQSEELLPTRIRVRSMFVWLVHQWHAEGSDIRQFLPVSWRYDSLLNRWRSILPTHNALDELHKMCMTNSLTTKLFKMRSNVVTLGILHWSIPFGYHW